MSYERQKKIIDDQIFDITAAINEVKASKGERFTVKQMESMKKGLQVKLDKLKADWKKDSTITFEQLGIRSSFGMAGLFCDRTSSIVRQVIVCTNCT